MAELSKVDYEHRFGRLANNMGTLKVQMCLAVRDEALVEKLLGIVREDLAALGIVVEPDKGGDKGPSKPAKAPKKPNPSPDPAVEPIDPMAVSMASRMSGEGDPLVPVQKDGEGDSKPVKPEGKGE